MPTLVSAVLAATTAALAAFVVAAVVVIPLAGELTWRAVRDSPCATALALVAAACASHAGWDFGCWLSHT